MKNSDKFKTAKERAEAFLDWCVAKTDYSKCRNCVIVHDCDCCPARGIAYWLDLEAEEEKPLPCPFCGSRTRVEDCAIGHNVRCTFCSYESQERALSADAIASHNRVAKAVKDGKGMENE